MSTRLSTTAGGGALVERALVLVTFPSALGPRITAREPPVVDERSTDGLKGGGHPSDQDVLATTVEHDVSAVQKVLVAAGHDIGNALTTFRQELKRVVRS